jgi:hypothetical protein
MVVRVWNERQVAMLTQMRLILIEMDQAGGVAGSA